MSLTDRNRSLIHRRLSELVGDEEAVSEMLSNFPVDDHDRPATSSDLAAFRGEMRGEFGDLRGEFAELRGDVADLRSEMHQMEARLTTTLHTTITRSTQWTIGVTLAAWSSLIVALVAGQTLG